MVRYGLALAFLVSQQALFRGQASCFAFQPQQSTIPNSKTRQRISASSEYDFSGDNNMNGNNDPMDSVIDPALLNFQATVTNVTTSYLDSLSVQAMQDDRSEAAAAARRQRVLNRRGDMGTTFKVTLPLAKATKSTPTATTTATTIGASVSASASATMGICIGQVLQGSTTLSDFELDLDTLKIVDATQKSFESSSSTPSSTSATLTQEIIRMDASAVLPRSDLNGASLVVTSVVKDSLAYQQGVRPGDLLTATSATLGDGMWPKSNLAGVQSALSSRKSMMAGQAHVSLEFRRMQDVVDNQFELTLPRPTGMQMQDSEEGYVVVTAIADSAPAMVRYGVRVGDRVIAVDSSFGDRLWSVSTVEGVISACTSRLPGKPVTMRFERPQANLNTNSETGTATTTATAAVSPLTGAGAVQSTTTSVGVGVGVSRRAPAVSQGPNKKDLLKRCREVLKRYAGTENTNTNVNVVQTVGSRFMGKYAVPAIVADKVVDALASASTAVDSVTLSMIMSAYLSCRQPQDAMRIFEAAVGFRADGSAEAVVVDDTTVKGKSGGRIVPDESALNLYTATAVLQAHALTGDIASVSRVLACLEGRSGVSVCGVESAPWPWTGEYGTIQPDTQCYNIAIAAAAKRGGEQGVDTALALFDQMNNALTTLADRRPQKDIVSYNTLISALTKIGRVDKAFALFDDMKRSGIRPDKFTYTSLIKACTHDGDVQELLFEMRERGVEADVVTYNSVIRSLCEDRKWTQATKLVTEMESRDISPDSMTYGLLMNAMLKADRPGACLALFESACASERTVSLTDNVHLYTTAITAASVLGDHERALELVSRMKAIGVKPNLKTLTAVMGACMSAGKAVLAAEVYQRIESPDGYAMSQGLRALCESGDLASASAMLYQLRGRGHDMTGKQIMLSYKAVIEAALEHKEFDTARGVLTDLLKKGYIPNKAIFQSMTDTSSSLKTRWSPESSTEDDAGEFAFLLFVMDSLQKRSLPVDASLYAATLFLGNRLGGLPRRIASLLAEAKTTTEAGTTQMMSIEVADDATATLGWEYLQLHYDSSDLTIGALPPLAVRVAAREMRKVLKAEQAVTFTPRNKARKERTARQ
jgi:pentatricopeptide repeat protein